MKHWLIVFGTPYIFNKTRGLEQLIQCIIFKDPSFEVFAFSMFKRKQIFDTTQGPQGELLSRIRSLFMCSK